MDIPKSCVSFDKVSFRYDDIIICTTNIFNYIPDI